MAVEYDDGNLQRLFAELEPRRRSQALKGGYRKLAAHVRKKAVANLRSSGIRTDRDLEKGVRSAVFKRTVGFRVTIGTKGETGMHTNRRGLKKPVLIWAEEGTQERASRNGHRTGSMPRFGFMDKTRNEVRDTVSSDMQKMVAESVERIAKKYGCK